MTLSCKDIINLHLKIKILVRRAFTATSAFGITTMSDLSIPYRAHVPNITCIKEMHLFWHLVSKKQLLEPPHLSHCWHKPLPEHLVLSMSEKIIQQLNFLGLNTETYHTIGFKTNQNSTKRDLSPFCPSQSCLMITTF